MLIAAKTAKKDIVLILSIQITYYYNERGQKNKFGLYFKAVLPLPVFLFSWISSPKNLRPGRGGCDILNERGHFTIVFYRSEGRQISHGQYRY
jgi:hypothetical protein